MASSPAVVAASIAPVVSDRSQATGAARSVDVICRDAWGAQPATGPYLPHVVDRVTIHHSGVVLRDNRDAPTHLRAYQRDHQSLGWPDIAYHFLVDLHGNVYRGRPPWARGDTRTTYDPAGHLLIMCIGNFEVQGVPRAQLSAAIDLAAWGCARFDVAPRLISGHRDWAATTCPGDRLYRSLADGSFRRRVRRRLGSVRLDPLCGRAGARRVRRIEAGTD
jgi:hypothetical protein